MPQITVTIPHYGDPAPTLALVSQLEAQDVELSAIVVVDDASPSSFPSIDGVQVVRRDVNGGFGSAVNSGARLASGDFILVLNSDLEVEPDFVTRMQEAAQRFPGAVLSPRVVDHNGELAWTGRDFPRVRHQAVEWLTPLARWRHTKAWHRAVGHDLRARTGDTSVDWVVGAAMLIPLGAFNAVGGFDERFFMNCEEVDLQLRLRAHGVPSIALGSPTIVHAGGGSSPSEHRRTWLVDARLRYAGKWGGRRSLRTALALCSVTNLAVNALRRVIDPRVQPARILKEELRLLMPVHK